MEVGQAAAYVDPTGKTQDAIVVKLYDGKANLVLVNADGGDDYLGKSRVELRAVPCVNLPGGCCDLDTYDPDKKPKTKKKAKKKKAE